MLIKSLIKRRYWWTVEESIGKANFVWTQLKVNNFYQLQKPSKIQDKYYKQVAIEKEEAKSNNSLLELMKHATKPGSYKAPLPYGDMKIFTKYDKYYYNKFVESVSNAEKVLKFENRLKYIE